MDKCPRCGGDAVFVGYEDARTFHQCQTCKRVWTTMVTAMPREGTTTPVRVLVADDSDQLVNLLAAWLEGAGYAVVTATTGRQALDAAVVHKPDVVLLDLIMPQPDGFQVCAKLARMPRPPEIILMTGISDPLHLGRARDLRAASLLRKPFEAESVVAAVRSAAFRRSYPRQGQSASQR